METDDKVKMMAPDSGAACGHVQRLVSTGMHPDLVTWERSCGKPLLIGSNVKIDPDSSNYEDEHDRGTIYKVTAMYIDSGGLNIGLDDGCETENYLCEMDGYYIKDLLPIM